MKTISMDFAIYEGEIKDSHARGYNNAMSTALRIIQQFNKGKSRGGLIGDHCEENCDVELVDALFNGLKGHPILTALKSAQAKLCENCPQDPATAAEMCGEHTDECLAAMDAIAKAEGRAE